MMMGKKKKNHYVSRVPCGWVETEKEKEDFDNARSPGRGTGGKAE